MRNLNYRKKNIRQHMMKRNTMSCWALSVMSLPLLNCYNTSNISLSTSEIRQMMSLRVHSIFLRVSNVHSYFRLPFISEFCYRRCHHSWLAACRLMQCAPDHLSWDAVPSIHMAIKPPTFHASWVLLKLQSSNRKCSFPQLLYIRMPLVSHGGLSFECSSLYA